MVGCAKQTVQNFGIRGLWTGLTGSLLRQATYGTTRFGVYNYLKEHNGAAGNPKSRLVMNGAIAGVFAGLVGAPAGTYSSTQ
jgi:dicarboxylate transporter 10